jgi:predicted DNA-binding transcriptional regulator AlpA
MHDQPLTRPELCFFFAVRFAQSGDQRGLHNILRALKIRLRGGTTRWPVVWAALGLSEEQEPQHYADLTAPLLTAQAVAQLLGLADSSIIYRWSKGQLPRSTPSFPAAIDLSNGRKSARANRWRQAEVLAWHDGKQLPQYAKAAPIFGALTPIK